MKSEGPTGARRSYRMGARAHAAEATANRLLDAAVALFTERPYDDVSLDDVAERAQVATRTVLRRFGSKEELFNTAMQRAAEEEMRRRDESPVGDVRQAVTNVVGHYERWGANRLRMLAQEDRIPVVAENVRLGREFHQSWVARTFAPLLDGLDDAARRRRIGALVVLTDVYTWKLLHLDLGLGRTETERTLVELIDTMGGAA